MSKYGIEYCEKLAHASSNGDLFGLPPGTESLVESFNDGIRPCGGQSSHVQNRPHCSSPSPSGAFASKVTTVAIKGSNASQRSDLFAVQSAQFRKLRQKSGGEDRPYPGYTLQQGVFFFAKQGSF